MSENIQFKTIWRAASLGGIVLAAVSTAYMLINNKLTDFGREFWVQAIVFTLDLVKIVACIWLMRRFMWQFKKDFPHAQRRDVRRVGTWIGLLSALIFATATMMYYTLNPEFIDQTLNTALEVSKGALDKNSLTALNSFKDNFAQYMFFSQLIYCSLFGCILSLILAMKIVPDNPFADSDSFPKDDKDDEELFKD